MDSRFSSQRIVDHIISPRLWRFCLFVSSLVDKASKLLDANKERILALFFFVLEAVSVVLDLIGKNKVTFLIAAFLLSAFGFAITLYSLVMPRTDQTIKAETQLKVVEIVFSVIQLIVTMVQYLLTVLEVKNDYNASAFPLAFSMIAVVFVFIKDGNTDSRSTNNLLPLTNLQPNMPTANYQPDTLLANLLSFFSLENYPPIASLSNTAVEVHKTEISRNQSKPANSVIRRSSTDPCNNVQEVVIRLEPKDEKAKREAVGAISCISGIDSISMDMKDNTLTMIGDIDTSKVLTEMRTICQIHLVPPVRLARMPEEEEKSEKKKEEAKLFAAYQAYDPYQANNSYQAYGPFVAYYPYQGYNPHEAYYPPQGYYPYEAYYPPQGYNPYQACYPPQGYNPYRSYHYKGE